MLVTVVSQPRSGQAISGQGWNGPLVLVTVAQALNVVGIPKGPSVIVALGHSMYATGSAGLKEERVEGMIEL